MQNATARPRFRQDLVAELIEEGGQRFIDVADPDSGHMFRFFEVEYSIACAMDGERDVAGIQKWAQEELGITPSANEVQTVIATLSDLQFIGSDRGEEPGTHAPVVAPPPVAVQPAAVAAPVAAKSAPAAKPEPEARIEAKPEAKTEAKAKADDLAAGVVVGNRASTQPSSDVELGRAGSSAPAPREDALPAADFALGAPGASSGTKQPPKAPVEDIALGAPGAAEPKRAAPAAATTSAADMSLDFDIKPGDVKEAVRQSKVMAAVEVPKELLEAEAKKPEPVVEKPKAEPPKAAAVKAEPPKAEPPKAADKAPAKDPPKAADKAPAKPAVELPAKPVVADKDKAAAEKQPVKPPAPSGGVSMPLVIVLVLVVLGAAGFALWKFVLNKPDTTSEVTPPPAKEPPPPPPPAEAASKVVMETPPAMEIKAGVAGTIETIEAADKDVKTGDVIATLGGGKPLQAEVTKLEADIAKLTPAVEAADQALKDEQAKPDNAARAEAAQKAYDKAKKPLADKDTALKAKKEQLAALTLTATADGKLAEPLKAGDKVTVDQVVAKVARPTAPVATFKLPAGTKLAADGALAITAGDKQVNCTIVDAQQETVKVSCPVDSGLADGADVKFTLPK